MILKKWNYLPESLKNDEVKKYYDILDKRKGSIFIKRIFDIIVSAILILFLITPILIIAIYIKADSKGKVFFLQKRVTTYHKEFYIFKFRTMVENAEKIGAKVTSANDCRITKAGEKLRKFRLDELPQIFNVFLGQMTFVGTRPEVPKYVNMYTKEMYATLLMPAGVTSLASLKFKDEAELLKNPDTVDEDYKNIVLPQKMVYNLEYIEKFSFLYDIKLMLKTAKDIFT